MRVELAGQGVLDLDGNLLCCLSYELMPVLPHAQTCRTNERLIVAEELLVFLRDTERRRLC